MSRRDVQLQSASAGDVLTSWRCGRVALNSCDSDCSPPGRRSSSWYGEYDWVDDDGYNSVGAWWEETVNEAEAKLKHLELIQGVINRMASNSFFLKGWCVTLVSAVLALSAKDADRRFALLAYYPVLMFWILDGYFLRQERLFRKLYDKVRVTVETAIDFSMDTSSFVDAVQSWPRVTVSVTLAVFYLTMVGAILLVSILR